MSENRKFKLIHKRILALLVIVLLAALIEGCFNYQAIFHGYSEIDLSQYITEEERLGSEKYVISYSSPKKIYIKQLKLTGTFPDEDWYTIKVTEVNPFGKKEEKTYSDTVNSWFDCFYTNLNKSITSLEIEVDKSENAELLSVSCSNNFEINKYRVVFFLCVFIMLYFAIFEKKFLEKPEKFLAVYALVFGMLIIFFAQPVKNSWDEQVHFESAYKLASGKNIEWTAAAMNLKDAVSVNCNTKAEYAQLRNYINEKGNEFLYTESKETVIPSYTMLAYIPQALFLKAGMLLHLPFTILYAAGKLGNLLLYTFVMYWAIGLAKKKKLLLTFIAMMPTNVFLAASYTYDTVVFSFITLACVIWINEMFFDETAPETWKVILMVALFTIGCFSKAVYIPLVLLTILLPTYQKLSKKNKVLLWGGVLLLVMLVMMTFVLPTLTSTVSRDLSFGGDSRGGDTSTVRQLISMIKHPWASVKLMLGSVIQFDNFRNLGYSSADDYFFGNLMFLNFGSIGILTDRWSAILVSMLAVLVLYKDSEENTNYQLGIWDKFVITVALLGTVFMIWLAMYLSFTPVGDNNIAGVQARYYLPLIYVALALVGNKKIKVVCDKKIITKATLIVSQILGWVLMYQYMLNGRLL